MVSTAFHKGGSGASGSAQKEEEGKCDAVILSHCRFSIAVQPLRISEFGDLVRVVANHPQFIFRERRMVWRLSAG